MAGTTAQAPRVASNSFAGFTGGTGNNDDGGFGKAITGQINVTAPGKNANIANSFIVSAQW